VLASAVKDLPLTDTQLAPLSAGVGMQAMIPRGMRAVTVDVSESSGVAGLLVPGCYVDVISTMRRGEETVALTVVENVKVQFVQRGKAPYVSRTAGAAAASGTPELGPAKTVTLLVTQKQAQKIELANSSGKPRLVLRGNADQTGGDSTPYGEREMLGLPPEAAKAEPVEKPAVTDTTFDNVAAPETPKRAVEIIRGGQSTIITYEEETAKNQEEGGAKPATSKGKRPAAGEPRTVSGTSPDPAPRTDAGRGNIR
jgi:pilus assembly protein CpaB